MNFLNIEFNINNLPELDMSFMPVLLWNRAFLTEAGVPVGVAVERDRGQIARTDTFIRGGADFREADRFYVERLVKRMLWMQGGFRVYISGDRDIYEYVKSCYAPGGSRDFDRDFMTRIYEKPFEVVWCDALPAEKAISEAVGRHLEGCRIGFDAGGSDRKVSAVIDGESVFSEEVVWNPKTNPDPDYHYEGIVSAMRAAASHMPRVDAIGVSSAGVFVNNRVMAASLFLKVPRDKFDEKVKDIYLRAAAEIGDVPVSVCNDGDVSALAGAMSLGDNAVLGIAMGTSEAVGYVDDAGRITGWLNELAFMPVDVNPMAMEDEWSGDVGCGVKYFSQDGVIKLARRAGVDLSGASTPAEKLKIVQNVLNRGTDDAAFAIYRSIGVYLGHTLCYYYSLYGFRHALLLGRVMSGKGGDVIVYTARAVIKDEYPEYAGAFTLDLPDEKYRRVGQSVAAASLPELAK